MNEALPSREKARSKCYLYLGVILRGIYFATTSDRELRTLTWYLPRRKTRQRTIRKKMLTSEFYRDFVIDLLDSTRWKILYIYMYIFRDRLLELWFMPASQLNLFRLFRFYGTERRERVWRICSGGLNIGRRALRSFQSPPTSSVTYTRESWYRYLTHVRTPS